MTHHGGPERRSGPLSRRHHGHKPKLPPEGDRRSGHRTRRHSLGGADLTWELTGPPGPPRQSAEWWEWVASRPAVTIPLLTAASTDKLLLRGPAVWKGMIASEFAGVFVRFQFLDGDDVTGDLIYEANTGANGLASANLPVEGVQIRRGIFFHVVSGTGTLRGGLYASLGL